jgi:hypothetical protein
MNEYLSGQNDRNYITAPVLIFSSSLISIKDSLLIPRP